MSWYYEFYKVYKTKPEDVLLWEGKDTDSLPEHLQFFSSESAYSVEQSEISEIQRYLEPITMMEEGKRLDGYLGTLYPVALFGRTAYEVKYKSPRNGWYRFVKLTNSKAKKMIRFAFCACNWFCERPPEVLDGYLGKKNEYKKYPGKLRNIVYFECQ